MMNSKKIRIKIKMMNSKNRGIKMMNSKNLCIEMMDIKMQENLMV